MTDLFKRGELKPCGKDTEITVDTSLSQMVEVRNGIQLNFASNENPRIIDAILKSLERFLLISYIGYNQTLLITDENGCSFGIHWSRSRAIYTA